MKMPNKIYRLSKSEVSLRFRSAILHKIRDRWQALIGLVDYVFRQYMLPWLIFHRMGVIFSGQFTERFAPRIQNNSSWCWFVRLGHDLFRKIWTAGSVDDEVLVSKKPVLGVCVGMQIWLDLARRAMRQVEARLMARLRNLILRHLMM